MTTFKIQYESRIGDHIEEYDTLEEAVSSFCAGTSWDAKDVFAAVAAGEPVEGSDGQISWLILLT